jgi:hypothetical protein
MLELAIEMAKDRDALFAFMIACGERLMEAQRLEESIGKACSKHGTPEDLAAWKEARQWVDDFTAEYVQAVREWREGIEAQLSEARPVMHKSLPNPLTLSRKPG